MSRGFDTYWLAGGEIWAARCGAPCEIDLELALALHTLHLREAATCAHAGDRPAAEAHRERAGELTQIILEQSGARVGCSKRLPAHEERAHIGARPIPDSR